MPPQPWRAVGSRPLAEVPPLARPRPAADVLLLLIQAIVLGLLQGLTEFLPVSSSGHLQGVPYLFGWDPSSLTFDVMVHGGTLLAVIVYFRDDLWQLFRGVVGLESDGGHRRRARVLTGLLALGTVPAAFAGFFFEDVFEAAFDSPRAVAMFLYLTVFLLWGAERLRTRRQVALAEVASGDAGVSFGTVDDVGRSGDELSTRDAIGIGVAQALAIFPGVSRSGATIAAGMALGLSRTAAARFSFLLSIPIILGAMVSRIPELGEPAAAGTLEFGGLEIAVGVTVAAVSGFLAIRFLLAVLQRRDLLGFARYVAAFATVLLVATFVI